MTKRRSHHKSRKSSLLAAIALVAVLGAIFSTVRLLFSSEKKPTIDKQARFDKLSKQSLRITEVTPLSPDFRIYFCTNHYLHWNTKPHGDTDIQWSYNIVTNDGKNPESNNLNLETLTFSAAPDFYREKRTNPDSSDCYHLTLYYQLKNMPYFKYQKGYNMKMQREMHQREVAERKEFYSSIRYVIITFRASAPS